LIIGMVHRLQGRYFTPTSRAAGPLLLCVLAMGIGVSIVYTLSLHDALPICEGYHLGFGSSTDNIYVASESSDILVVDGETFQRIKRINTGPVGGALLVNEHNRLYCAYPQQGRIGIIDCATNNVVGSIRVGTRPTLLCYSSGSDKLYCGDTIDRTVTVIDCAADTVRKVISVGRSLTAMAYDPTTNKVYAATRDAVRAISCSADSIAADIDAVKSSIDLCINRRRQKLYAIGPLDQHPGTLYVISIGTDSVTAKILWYYGRLLRLTCNEVTDRLYGVNAYGDFAEFDCVRDTMLRTRALGARAEFGMPCDTVRNRLYYLVNIALQDYICVLDCATPDVISRTRVGEEPGVLGLDLDRCRVMCGGSGRWYSDAVLAVFDCKYDSLFARGYVPLCGNRGGAVHNPVDRKLYYRWGEIASAVGVVDEQNNRVVRHVVLPKEPGVAELAYSRTSNKLYCGSPPGVVVLDGTSDSVLKLVDLVGGCAISLCWCPDYNKLYCTGMDSPRWYMAVLDCYGDSVIKEIEFYDRPGDPMYIGNGRLFYLYHHRMALIDCRNDSVLVDTAFTGTIRAVAHTAVGEKIYMVHGPRLEVLSSSTLSLLATVDWAYPWSWTFLVCAETTNKLYWFKTDMFVTEPDSVLVIDTRSDTVVA